MNLEQLSFGLLENKFPVILQTEASECGLACIAMVASYYKYNTDLFTLRMKYSIPERGATLKNLIDISQDLSLTTRPLKLDLDDLSKLKLPCILHWNLNHFIVLKKVHTNEVTIIDPSFGERKLTLSKVSNHFSGIALELWPNSNFKEKKHKKNIRIKDLIGKVNGAFKTLGQIFIFSIAIELFTLALPFFMQWVIDNVLVSFDRNLLTTLALGFGILGITIQVIKLLQGWSIMHMSTTLNLQWKSNIFEHLVNLPNVFFSKRHLGDIISRFNSIDSIQKTITASFISSVLDGLFSFFTLILMFFYSMKLTVCVLIATGIYAISRWLWYAPLRRSSEEEIIHLSKQNTHFMETIRGIQTIKLYGKQNIRQMTWVSLLINQINASLTTQKISMLFGFTNGLIFSIENVIVIWLGATAVLDGNFTVGALTAFIAYKSQFISRINSLIDKIIEFKMLDIHGERLADIVLHEKNNSTQAMPVNNIGTYDINVKNLYFRHSIYEKFILENINLQIKEGESIAIIGPTGRGKSTLMNLMLASLKPSSGEVKLGGIDLFTINQKTLCKTIATVKQDDVLFAGSISDNISFFDENYSPELVEESASLACIHQEIMAMPMGYQTLVGDMGNVLSGGQKQRILLARALYQKPKILFLDEATSHLDIQKEYEINQMISKLKITRVIIAHRPETIRSTDRIFCIETKEFKTLLSN